MANESGLDDYYDYDDDNETHCKLQELPHARWILPTLYSIFFLVGFLGNVVVIAVVSKRSSRRADTFILNLAVSDLLFVLMLPLWASSYAIGNWPFEAFLCQASRFVIAVSRCASSSLMAVMSVDRYVAVIKGKKMNPLRTRSCSLGACCTIWAVSVLVGCPLLVIRDSACKGFDDRTLCEGSDDRTLCEGSDDRSMYAYKMVVMVLTFVLPFAVVLFCYCRMAKYLWNYFGKSSTGKPRRGHNWLRIVSCVVGAFCLSWLPYNTINTLVVISNLGLHMPCPTTVVIHQALPATAALACANSCSNPLIYALLDAGFRHRAQLSLPGLFLTCRSMLPIPGWSVPTTTVSMESTSTYTGN